MPPPESSSVTLPEEGRTNWKRTGLMFFPLVGCVGVMVLAMAQGALAASFAVSGSAFQVSASEVHADSVSSFPSSLSTLEGEGQAVLLAAVEEGSASDVCVSLIQDLPMVGEISMIVRSGVDSPIQGTNLVVNTEALTGASGTVHNVEAGRDASTLQGTQGPEGLFGVQASSMDAVDVESTAWAANGGTLTLEGLEVEISPSGSTCF